MSMAGELGIQATESIDTFKVIFGGDEHTINAELFTKTINNTIALVKASAIAINPQAFVRLEIKANKEGSFETTIDAVVKHSQDLFTKDNVRLACDIVRRFFDFLKIKRFLGGKKAKKLKQKAIQQEL